jgi:hypothetical protein
MPVMTTRRDWLRPLSIPLFVRLEGVRKLTIAEH